MNRDITYITDNGKFNYRVCAVFIRDNQLLAMRDERSPYFYLPGGRVRLRETAEDALRREMREELSIDARIIRPLWLNQAFFTEDVEHLNYHELCLYFLTDGEPLYSKGQRFTMTEGAQTHCFEWLSFERLKDEYLYPLFIKQEIYHLPDTLTLRSEFE